MRIIDATRRSGLAIAADRTVRAAAQFMEQASVGALACPLCCCRWELRSI